MGNLWGYGTTAASIGSDLIPIYHGGQTKDITVSSLFENVARSYSVLNHGAVGDGSTDDHSAFNATIALGNRILIPDTPLGYFIGGLVSPASNQNIEGNGYASLLTLGSGTGKTMKLQSLSHVTLRDFRIDGTNLATANAYGIFVDQSDDITIDHVWVVNCNGFGIFLNNSGVSSEHGKIRVINSYLTGNGNADVLGGGSTGATPILSELIITGNFIIQNVNSANTYYNAIDIVAQHKTVIANNVTQGNIILGGEAIPHQLVDVISNVIGQAPGSSMARIAVLTSSLSGQAVDSTSINIIGNQINGGSGGGQILVQGQSSTSNRTRKVIIKGNNIIGGTTNIEECWGIDLNYLANISVEGNIIDGAFRGIYVNDVQTIDISNNTFINCTTPIVIGSTAPTNMTGHNNVGINPDVMYAQGNVTGITTFDRVNGIHQTATLTGNITITLASTFFNGELLTLELTQDGTGSRTATWPANFKKAGGSLILSTAAGATDTITMRWDSTNWVEVSRALNVS